jgi:hypothetical protein
MYLFGTRSMRNPFIIGKIINNKNLIMREDLMCFARLLYLIVHYEMGKDFNLESQLKSTYKFFIENE